MTKNLNTLSKAELIAMLNAKDSAPLAAPKADLAPVGMSPVEKELLAALALSRIKDEQRVVDQEDTRQVVEIANVSGMSLGIEVRDPVTNASRYVGFEREGQKHKVSSRQLRELRLDYPHIFEAGYLQVIGEDSDNPNLVPSVAELVEKTPIDDMASRIEAITSVDTCFKIYGYLEQRRYVNVNDKGEAIEQVDASGKRVMSLETRQLPPKEMTMLTAVQRRISQLSNTITSIES